VGCNYTATLLAELVKEL